MNDSSWKQAIIPLVTITFEGKISEVNNRFIDLVGYSEDELIGSHIEKVMDSGARFFFNSMLYPKLMIEKEVQEVYLSLKTKEFETKHIMFNAQVVGSDQVILCYIVPVTQRAEYTKEIRAINKKLEDTIKEKTQLHEDLVALNKELKRYAERDWLTSLYNRRLFMDKLTDIYEAFQQNKKLFSICILDIDHFKQVNDQYGHFVGDQVLVGIAEEMKQFFGPDCTLGRFGGEEFTILLPGYNQFEAFDITDSFREQIKRKTWHDVSITISLGVSTMSHLRTIDDMIVGADNALYKAKNKGRDRVELDTHSSAN